MKRELSIVAAGLLYWTLSFSAAAQTTARLSTKDTSLSFRADLHQPWLLRMKNPGGLLWQNRIPESPIDHIQVGGKTEPLSWRYNSKLSRIDNKEVQFVYDSESPQLRWRWTWRVRNPRGPIEHDITIENLSAEDIRLPLQNSFSFDWQIAAASKLDHFYIEKGAGKPGPVGCHLVSIHDGYAWQGTSTTYAENDSAEIIPWFLVHAAGDSANGWYVGLEFAGCTQLGLSRRANSLSGSAGMNPPPGSFWTALQPGKTFLTPTIFLGAFAGQLDDAGKDLRAWVRSVLTNPGTWKKSNYPLLVDNTWGGGMEINESKAEQMIRDSAVLGFELFGLDAGWFRGVGDWYPDPVKFPHGLAAIADYAHLYGMGCGLWIDWSQAGVSTHSGALNVHDPQVNEWLTLDPPPGWAPVGYRGITIDIGEPAAEAWTQRELERIVRDDHLDMLEHDGYLVAKGCDRHNHPHLPAGASHQTVSGDLIETHGSNDADVSYHAARAYSEIYEDLRKKFPSLLFEACNDGGRMVDFGTASHVDYICITDTYDPLSNRRAFYDASYVLPCAMLECYVEKEPTPRIENLRYMLRSGMMGWLTAMFDTTKLTPQEHAAAKAEFELYKTKLRSFIRDADLYHISPRPDGIHWDGIEYFNPHWNTGVIYAFRGSTKSEPVHNFVLKGLDPGATYHLHFNDGTSPDASMSGSNLLTHGLRVTLPLPESSELIFVEKKSVTAGQRAAGLRQLLDSAESSALMRASVNSRHVVL